MRSPSLARLIALLRGVLQAILVTEAAVPQPVRIRRIAPNRPR